MVFQGKLEGNLLVGTTTGQDGTPWKWTAKRAPSLKRSGTPKWGKPHPLFNGNDLTGWKTSDPNSKVVWTVENGTLVSGQGTTSIQYTTGSLGNTTVRYTLESYKDYSTPPTDNQDDTCKTIQAAGGVSQKQVDAKYHFTAL